MKNKYIFLRHAETIKDPNKATIDWDLVPEGLELIQKYINANTFESVTKIYSSTEPKAIATGKPIAEKLKLPIETSEMFVEVKREKKFLTEEEFLNQKQRELINLDQIENGAESASTALSRFESGIQELEEKYSNETILVISHGTVMSLYFAKIQNQLSETFSRWKNIKFCAVGVVENNIVTKDII